MLITAWQKGALRWLILLESSNLMLDVFRGYLALYLADVVAASQAFASLTLVALTVAGLTGGVLMVPLLARISGIVWLRFTALGSLVVFPVFLLVGSPEVKLALAALLGLLTSGWYSVLKAGLYAQLPGQSGTAMTLSNVGGLAGGIVPIVLGFVAQHFGLQTTMWLLLAAPATLLIGLPGEQRS
jgi:FSR family fosmidomycin resistance protein-like MFS transporter